MNITWNTIKELSTSLHDELENLIKEKFYNLINKDAALTLIINSSKLNYLITNFKRLKNPEKQIIEEFNKLLKKEIENLKILEKDPDFNPKEQTNLCKILDTTAENLEEIVSLLSQDLQKFLTKLYDENWNEKKIPNGNEKKILKKLIKLLNLLLLDIKRPNNLSTCNNLNHTVKLNDFELIIVMGLISENNFDVNLIADFLQLPKDVVTETICNTFKACQENHSLTRKNNKR